jgi:hypothetical protein
MNPIQSCRSQDGFRMAFELCLLNKFHIRMVPSPYVAANFRFSRNESERTSKEEPVCGKRSLRKYYLERLTI